MNVKTQVFIKASKNAVWTAITDIRNASEIIKGIEKIEIVDEPLNGIIGLKWRETRIYFGKPATIEKWIIDAHKNKFYKTRAESDGFIFETILTIVEIEGGVNLISSHDSKAQGIVAKMKSIPMVFFKGMLQKALIKDLNDIKAAIEKQ